MAHKRINIREAVFWLNSRVRRIKFAVTGLINSPPSKTEIKKFALRCIHAAARNPKKYIPALKAAGFTAAAAAYITLMLFAGAAYTGVTGVPGETDVDALGGFVAGGVKPAITLDWDDGAVELVNGKAQVKLTAQVTPKFLERVGITWSVSDKTAARVSGDGTVTAVKAGTVYITASLNGSTAKATAKLQIREPLSGILMTTSNVTLYNGGAGKYLKVRYFPDSAAEEKLVWRTKNEKVATVNSSGHVKPVGLGMTEVTAETEDGKFSCRAFVTVINYAVKVDKVSIENENSELAVGGTLNLIASVSPYNAKNKTLKWSSGDESILTVNQTGRVKGISEGTAAVTVTSANGVTASVDVTVTKSDKKDGFNLYDEAPSITSEGGVRYTAYDMTISMMAERQMGLSPAPKIWKNGGSVDATLAEVIEYLNPANYGGSIYKYQFLDLSSPNGVSAEVLNAFLAGKGILAGQGETFKRAAEMYNVSEVYLAAHACLESGNGTSQLATGVDVNGTTVYNMFGIGAYDTSALTSGSQKAYSEGWTSVEKAIEGGARWISEFYINSADGRQNTLYKMLWNPAEQGTHQYATDVGWAVKQAAVIADIFKSFPEAVLSYDVPVYNGQTAPYIDGE